MPFQGLRRRVALLIVPGLALLAMVVGAACGSDSDEAREHEERTASACALVARLATASEPVEGLAVDDPTLRDKLDAALLDYVNTLDSLAQLVPESLRTDVTTVRGHVQRYEWMEAIAARAPIDDWASRSCD